MSQPLCAKLRVSKTMQCAISHSDKSNGDEKVVQGPLLQCKTMSRLRTTAELLCGYCSLTLQGLQDYKTIDPYSSFLSAAI